MNTFNIYKDGKLVHTCNSQAEVLTAMHKLQPFSMHHALKYEGYEILGTLRKGNK